LFGGIILLRGSPRLLHGLCGKNLAGCYEKITAENAEVHAEMRRVYTL